MKLGGEKKKVTMDIAFVEKETQETANTKKDERA